MKNINTVKFRSLILSILLTLPIFSFAADAGQELLNLKQAYGDEIKPKTYTNLLNFCGQNNMDIESCLTKLAAQSSDETLAQNNIKGGYCCVNVSGFVGEYAFIRGQSYCIPPC